MDSWSLAPPFVMSTRERDPDDRPDRSGGTRPRKCVSSDDDELGSPTSLGGAGVRVAGGTLLGGGGRVVRHVDSFVRSTRHRGRGDRPDEPVDKSDDEGSPRSRRLTFEFRNFNLYPDPRDGERSPGLLEKRRPSRSLDIPRVDEEPEYAGYLTSPTFSSFAPQDASYYGYGQMAPQSPLPSIQTRSPDVLPVITTSPPPNAHSYRSIQSIRPAANLRTYSDIGPSRRPNGERREKKVVTLREAAPVPIREEEDDGSSELSEPEDADGPCKSGDSSVTSGPRSGQHRRKLSRARKKKPYKSRRCDICNKTFTKECDVTRHRRTAHGEDEIEFKCHECGRLFNRKDALERHYKVYEGTPHVARRYQPKTYLGQNKK